MPLTMSLWRRCEDGLSLLLLPTSVSPSILSSSILPLDSPFSPLLDLVFHLHLLDPPFFPLLHLDFLYSFSLLIFLSLTWTYSSSPSVLPSPSSSTSTSSFSSSILPSHPPPPPFPPLAHLFLPPPSPIMSGRFYEVLFSLFLFFSFVIF